MTGKQLDFIKMIVLSLSVVVCNTMDTSQPKPEPVTFSLNQNTSLQNQTDVYQEYDNKYIPRKLNIDDNWNYSSTTKRKLPEFMLKLYQSLNKDQTKSETQKQLPLGADSVRSFTHIGGRTNTMPVRLKFAIKIPATERVLLAFIQCYFQLSFKNEGDPKKDIKPRYVNFVLSYRLANLTVSRIVRVLPKPTLVTFPVTKVINQVRNRTSKVILINVLAFPFSSHADSSRDIKVVGSRDKRRQPVIVVFIRDKSGKEPDHIDLPRFLGMRSLQSKIRRYPRETSSCHVTDLPVNFYEIGYKHIIAPLAYDAKQCVGRCTFPLGKNSQANIHAQIQAILHSLKGSASVTEVSCVPIKLSSITLIYSDQTFGNSLVLRSFPDMVVDECGCR